MRHRVKQNLRLNHRDTGHRTAIVRNLVTSFFLHSGVVTTAKKAMILSQEVDRIIRIAQSDAPEMNKIRSIQSVVFTPDASRRALELAKKMKTKESGFTRVTPIKYRVGDAAKLVKIEFVLA